MTGEHADQVVVKKGCLIISQHVDLLAGKRADLVTDEETGFIFPWLPAKMLPLFIMYKSKSTQTFAEAAIRNGFSFKIELIFL